MNQAARAVSQGATFGFGDEIAAAGDALLGELNPFESRPIGQRYAENLEHERALLDKYREENPVSAITAEVAGALPTVALGAGVAGGVRALSQLPKAAKVVGGGASGGAAYGAGTAEGDLADRARGAAEGAVVGTALAGAGGAAAKGVGRMIRGRRAKKAEKKIVEASATLDELREAASKQFNVAKAAQGTVPTRVYAPFVERLATKLQEEGAAPILHNKMMAALRIMANNADRPPSLMDLQILRRQFQAVAKSTEPDERRLGQIAMDAMDDFVDKTAGKLGGTLAEGRQLWNRMRKAELIEETIEAAKSRAAGTEAGLRNEFSKLYRNKKLMRGFTPKEKAAIKAVFQGNVTRNTMRVLGGLSPGEGQRRNILNALVGGGVGMSAAGPGGGMVGMAAGMIGPTVVGGAAQKAAERGTMRAAEYARALAAGPRPRVGVNPFSASRPAGVRPTQRAIPFTQPRRLEDILAGRR